MPLKTVPYVIDDFGGGVVTDNNIRKSNELMEGKNIVLDAEGGYEKRKGTELLTAVGTGLNSESDIWGYILHFFLWQLSDLLIIFNYSICLTRICLVVPQ